MDKMEKGDTGITGEAGANAKIGSKKSQKNLLMLKVQNTML